jgi:transposase
MHKEQGSNQRQGWVQVSTFCGPGNRRFDGSLIERKTILKYSRRVKMLRIIGIDLAVTAAHKAMILNPVSNQFIGKQISFRARPADLDRLLVRAKSGIAEPVELVAVLEATGMAWYPVGVYLHRQGVKVYRVNGRQTKDLRQVYSKHAGSDRIDSRVLAHLYQVAAEHMTRWLPPCGETLALQRACREFVRWREQGIAIQNRLTSYDHWAWGGLNKLVPALAQEWMRRNWYNPWRVQEAGVECLEEAWTAANPGKTVETDWIARWVARAEEMTRLYGSEAMVGYDPLQGTMARNLDLQAQGQAAKSRLSKEEIQPRYQSLFSDRRLETITGIGADSAAIYMAFIQSIDRFPTIAQFRKWTGMVPGSHQSGQFESKGLSLTQAGPNIIKATLYLNAQVARQWDAQMAAIYHTQMVSYGKHHTQAVCACASHLASRIYAVLTQKRDYQLRDPDGNPITREESRRLCLTRYHVPEEIRRRNNVRHRRQQVQTQVEQRYQRRQRKN